MESADAGASQDAPPLEADVVADAMARADELSAYGAHARDVPTSLLQLGVERRDGVPWHVRASRLESLASLSASGLSDGDTTSDDETGLVRSPGAGASPARSDEGGEGGEGGWGGETADVTFCVLSTGEVHMCAGCACPHVEDRGDGQLVCGLSGCVVGTVLSAATDYGAGQTSGDPDMASGGRTWRRRSTLQDSKQAFFLSKQIDTSCSWSDPVPSCKKHRASGGPVRRGARCVDEPAAPPRNTVPVGMSREKCVSLTQETKHVFHRIVVRKRSPTALADQGAETSAQQRVAAMDPRTVVGLAMRRYVDRVASGNDRFDMCRLHDVVVAANAYVAQTREQHDGSRSVALFVSMQEDLAWLIVTLWCAATKTPFFTRARTSTESFRSFVCGFLYGTKRGLRWETLQVVPHIVAISDVLPSIRNSAATDEARAMQSSSHKGLCMIHQTLNSVSTMSREGRRSVLADLEQVAFVARRLERSAARE